MTEVRLSRPPALLPLYVRAALPRRGSGAVPSSTLVLPGQRPDIERVARYARLCGFPLRGELPVTYPHLVGFPLQMALMADRRFPFPATGLVHVAQEVTQGAGIPVGAPLDVRVRAEGPRAHPRGRSVDLLTDVQLDGDTVWTGRSTYLRRSSSSSPGSPTAGRPGSAGADGQEQPPTTAVWRLPADLGRRYAAVSGDRNPIHLWRLTARAFGFPRPIAHGMWTAAAAVAALDVHGRLEVSVEFRAPVLLPSTVELATGRDGDEAQVVLRSRSGRTHLRGRVRDGNTPAAAGGAAS